MYIVFVVLLLSYSSCFVFHFQKNKNNILALIQYARATHSSPIFPYKKNSLPALRAIPAIHRVVANPLVPTASNRKCLPRSLSLGIEGKEDGSILLRPAPPSILPHRRRWGHTFDVVLV